MLRELHLRDVGPARALDFAFAPRLNILTGDNGLGKSFVLDVAWWTLTGHWSGEKAFPRRPHNHEPGTLSPQIQASVASPHETGSTALQTEYVWKTQEWRERVPSGPPSSSLVVYARIDGSFAVWDAFQAHDEDDPPNATTLLKPGEVWDGKYVKDEEGRRQTVCRGLLDDWLTWQGTHAPEFGSLTEVLSLLSTPDEPLTPGPPTRVDLKDRRDIPTLTMPYGAVPVTLASAGQRRILALAYILVWTWTEHRRAAAVTQQATAPGMVLLLDEVEMHLHPRWQRLLLPALLRAIASVAPEFSVQLLATTHAPLVLASLEPLFDEDRDNLYRFELQDGAIQAHDILFAKQGDAANWLVSETFGVEPRSAPAEAIIEAASAYMRGDKAGAESALKTAIESLDGAPFDPSADLKARIHATLRRLLPGHDDFWPRWIVSNDPSLARGEDDR